MLLQVGGKLIINRNLHPYLYAGTVLHEPQHRVELKELFSFGWLVHLYLHGVVAAVVEYQLAAVNVPRQAQLQIVQRLFDVDWHLYAFTSDGQYYRRAILEIFEMQLQGKLESADSSRSYPYCNLLLAVAAYASRQLQSQLLQQLFGEFVW